MTEIKNAINEQFNLPNIYDPDLKAIRTTASFGGDLLIDATQDSMAIGDAVTGETAKVEDGRLLVNSNVTGSLIVPPPTDFRVVTLQATTTAKAITFSNFTINNVAIKSLSENSGYIRIGKSTILGASDNYYLLSPGESLNLALAASDEPLYYAIDPDAPAGNYRITVAASN